MLQGCTEAGADFYIKNKCSGCLEDNSFKEVVFEENKIFFNMLGRRSEIATNRFDMDEEIEVSFDVEFGRGFDSNVKVVIAQLIDWQRGCFEGGNFQIQVVDGLLFLVARNWGETRELYIKPQDLGLNKLDEEKLSVRIEFLPSQEEGFLTVSFTNDDVTKTYKLISDARTHVNCPLGPYFKTGIYGTPKSIGLIIKNLEIVKR